MSSTAQQEAEALLKDIDKFSIPSGSQASGNASAAQQGDALQAIEFLDQITKVSEAPLKPKLLSNTPSRPASRATERVSLPALKAKSAEPIPSVPTPEDTGSQSPTGWNWGSSVWSSASAALQQARSAVDEGVRNIHSVPQAHQTRQWRDGLIEYVKSAQLDKLGW